jgi:hypothetical protein
MFEGDIKNIIFMAKYNKKNETINFFQIIYHSIKDLIEAGEHDVFTINGKFRFLRVTLFFFT